ncbi:putative reverse transcriptase domain-containing protein [Tanacetum coccineum]
MAPKRATRSKIAPETTNTTSVTNAQLQAMINQGVTAALAARDANTSTNGDDSHISGTGELALLCGRMFLEESNKIEKYVGGLPDMIHGSVVASKPKTMQDAVEIATELMDKKIRTFAERQGHFKRECPKLKNNNNRGNQVGGGNAPAKVYAVGHARTTPDSNIVTVFLANVTTKETEDKSEKKQFEDVPIVRDFPDVFPKDCFLTLGKLGLICQKEGWIVTNVHRLSGTEQADSEESLSTPKDRRYVIWLTNALSSIYGSHEPRVQAILDKLVIVFINDILIYSKNKKEHEEHLKSILELIKKEELYAKFSKCKFWIPKVQFLGHVIDSQGIHMDPAKIESIKDWESPKTPTEIRLNFISAPILALPEGSEDFVVYCRTYASLKDTGAVFMQREETKYAWQRRWLELLSDYDCEIRYHLGKANVVADALSRKEQRNPLRV